MPKLLGVIGVLVVCAGLDLLWQSRHEITFWLAAYLRVFRSMLHHQGSSPRSLPATIDPRKRHGAVRVLLGMSFTFIFGPILIAIGITLMLFPRF